MDVLRVEMKAASMVVKKVAYKVAWTVEMKVEKMVGMMVENSAGASGLK